LEVPLIDPLLVKIGRCLKWAPYQSSRASRTLSLPGALVLVWMATSRSPKRRGTVNKPIICYKT
jgi:hypothetical protein